ncbi:MAG: C4-dicarboxylate ABC transporter substrate-binding protein, partial [Sphaerochaeta sp.]|nr:C4-dicarboxylate ABC transporter substrate-binding protein [Sphaerochaeta sp.]
MKKLTIALLLVVMVLPMAFSQGAAESANKPVELVYTMTAVPTDAHAGAMRVFKETVEKVSNGQIKVLTYDSASLFKQEQEVSAIKSG